MSEFGSLSWQNLMYFSHMMALASGSNMTEKELLSSAIVSVLPSLWIEKLGPNGKPRALMYFRFFLIFWATTTMSMNRKMPYFLRAPAPEAKAAGPRAMRMRSLLTFFSKMLLAPGSMFWTKVTDNWFSFFNFGSSRICSIVRWPKVAAL